MLEVSIAEILRWKDDLRNGIPPSAYPRIAHTCARIDTLLTPPIIGATYLVPCVPGDCCNDAKLPFWPIVFPAHRDKELGVSNLHYHYDWRFIPVRIAQTVTARHNYTTRTVTNAQALAFAQATVDSIHGRDRRGSWKIAWKEMRCLRHVTFPSHGLNQTGDGLRPVLPTIKCELLCQGKRMNLVTMLCPHRGVSLRQQPIVDGCVTCPGHGLRFSMATGNVVTRFSGDEWAKFRLAQAQRDAEQAASEESHAHPPLVGECVREEVLYG